VVRDFGLTGVFAVLRDCRGWRGRGDDADASLQDVLAAALEANERLRAELAVLQRLVSGRSSERARAPGLLASARVEAVWDFPGGGYCCPQCGVPFTRLGDHVLPWNAAPAGLRAWAQPLPPG
jgi:hypothetical protein